MGRGSMRSMASPRMQRWTQEREQGREAPSPHLGNFRLVAGGTLQKPPHLGHSVWVFSCLQSLLPQVLGQRIMHQLQAIQASCIPSMACLWVGWDGGLPLQFNLNIRMSPSRSRASKSHHDPFWY